MNNVAPILFIVIYLAVIALVLASLWVIYTKAGEPGWASIVPIYNIIVQLRIVGKPEWWIILYIIPCVGLIVALMVTFELAKVFGKSGGFAVGLLFLPFIFYPLLAWGDAEYIGPDNLDNRNRKRSVSRFDDDDDYDDRDRDDDDRPRRRRSRDDDDDDDDRPRRR